ncbi:chemotaxis protein CheW [Vibrio sinensis]|uniref:Chemotaxis protein CheW n=1 Tax=Vibrio sinensis TaxID=2302434 RepID=A0A3A6QT83_9VIBR|nr:chemotaxis protein CheW [Vibrio sinensis]RJX73816.1 chemotaxis protein CheW [Vibrio sinensis]
MSERSILSGEQALDDYFASLLDEQLPFDEDIVETVEPTIEHKQSFHSEVELQAKVECEAEVVSYSNESSSYAADFELKPQLVESDYSVQYPTALVDIEVPNLQDVERLLKQLESSNPVEESQIEEMMQQNTAKLAAEKVHVPVVTELDDEIQDWVIEESDSVLSLDQQVQLDTIDNAPAEVVEIVPPKPLEAVETTIAHEVSTASELKTLSHETEADSWVSTQRSQAFQVLYFDVNGVLFAVPLDELGGIHRLGELSHLIGRPAWYLGLQSSREAQLDVVDTAKWVMADKLKDDTYKDEYQYIVMLGESKWGLASTQLKGTELLHTDSVRWREMAGKRPWLAGMVKEKMCALIHVEALITMLSAGLDVKALNK